MSDMGTRPRRSGEVTGEQKGTPEAVCESLCSPEKGGAEGNARGCGTEIAGQCPDRFPHLWVKSKQNCHIIRQEEERRELAPAE